MISYRIDACHPNTHRITITLTVEAPVAEQRLSLPVWIPGSYLVREFSRHVSGIRAEQGNFQLPVTQLDKTTWQIQCRTSGSLGHDEALVVQYAVYAFDTSVRAAFLDAHRGFFNGTAVLLRVEGAECEPHRVELRALPDGWQVATALPSIDVDEHSRGTYEASGYDALVDHPVELGTFWRGRFEARGVPHEYIVSGALPDIDTDRLLRDAQRICEAQIDFWHLAGEAPPFIRYVFLHNLVEEGHGGLEHRASTALISPRRDMPQRGRPETSEGYANLLGLVSHEYFHTWNVKRLKPAEFATIDYTRENYTQLLWFFEGFTSYYDDLLLLRTGLIDAGRYLKLLSRTLTGVLGSPGRRVQSLAEASFDAWVKYYRSDENTPNATISYYAKGSLVALALDLTLRAEGRGTLDDVMRLLWATSCAAGGLGTIDEAAILHALQQVGGRSFEPELAAWVHGTDELPLPALLAEAGIDWGHERATVAQRLGVRVSESALTGVKVSHVLRDEAGEAAGLSVGDEVLAVAGWRVRRLDDALRLIEPDVPAPWMVARDQRVLSLSVSLPSEPTAGTTAAAGSAHGAVLLKAAEAPAEAALALRKAWLAEPPH